MKNAKRKPLNLVGRLLDDEVLRLVIIFVVFVVIASLTKTDKFFRLSNFQNMMIQMSEFGLMSLGCGIAMITGGIDLSTVYISNLSGILACLAMNGTTQHGYTFSIIIGVLTGITVGILCGLFNGFLIAKLNVPPMLATLGTFQLFLGLGIVASKGGSVSGQNSLFSGITSQNVLSIVPLAFLIFVLCTVILSILMGKTITGTHAYLVGTNSKAARYSGVNNTRIIMSVYMISGILSSIAGLISLSRLNTAKADFGSSYTMLTILISVLGGVNPNGGFGRVSGIAVGVVTLQVISSYLNMFPTISNYYRDLIWGAALIGVLILNSELEKLKVRKQMQKQKA